MSTRHLFVLVIAVCIGSALAGCGKPADNKPVAVTKADSDADAHGGWWCNEHGVPEEVCALCDKKLVADFKAKNDWCKHDRPESQCFTCHPEKQAEFAALYEAKYGKQPPKPTDNGA